jgi:hypothetical protein
MVIPVNSPASVILRHTTVTGTILNDIYRLHSLYTNFQHKSKLTYLVWCKVCRTLHSLLVVVNIIIGILVLHISVYRHYIHLPVVGVVTAFYSYLASACYTP